MTGSEWRYSHSPLLELQSAGSQIQAVAFSANGKYLINTHCEMIEAWRIKNGARITTMTARHSINCLAISLDGRWMVAGTKKEVSVWDANAFKQVFTLEVENVIGIDFAPDSTRLLVASDAGPGTATVWDMATRERVLTLHHDHQWVRAAKYSPQGDRIATATPYTVRVWDSSSGSLLVVISVEVTPWYNTGLLWFNSHLFVISDNTIKQLKASTGEKISEWPVKDTNSSSSITVPLHREFIVYSTNRTVAFLDTSKQVLAQLDVIQDTQDICSIALSPDDQFIAIAGKNGKISVRSLSPIIDLIPLSRLHPTFRGPDIQIDDAVLNSWICDELEHAESLLTAAIPASLSSGHHALASRALIRAHLGQLDTALVDAKQSMKIRPSAIGYIAKSTVLARMGKRHKAYRACDIALERFHANHVSFLILIKAIIVFMAGEHADAISRLDDLIATVRFKSICYVVQSQMYLLLGNAQVERNDYEGAIRSYEHARANLRDHASQPLLMISLISGWKFDELAVDIQQRLCEALRAAGRTKDACQSFFDLVNNFDEMVYAKQSVMTWISHFTSHCLLASDSISDIPFEASTYDNIAPITPASLYSISAPLLRAWARATLASVSWKDALASTTNFVVPLYFIYQAVCERLEEMGCVMDASECFCQMVDGFAEQADPQMEQAEWVLDFKRRCCRKLGHLGDDATKSGQHDNAISYYSAALSLHPSTPQDLFIKRSKAYVSSGLWKDALNDANLVIVLDPASPWGYERKRAALHEAGEYENAIDAYRAMLSNMLRSPDREVRERYRHYVSPEDTRLAIQEAVDNAIRDSPHVLINTISGRLVNKSEQAAAFESLPIFKELISSMTTDLDQSRIVQAVTEYYRYAMFSHKWEANEPLFQKVAHIAVYNLDDTSTHRKLKAFCKIVRDAGLHWAWSDTCCIDQMNHIVLQEALVAMFRWYQGSHITIIFLGGVRSPGGLTWSIWNTRAWTLQEYHASKVVRFYNEDWTLYMSLDIPNHKDSPEIISEMEQATGISAQTLTALRPGSTNIREKLRLASKRDTSRVEDAAYSLLGIFSMTMSIVYGEKDKSLGRLLAQLLTNSGDTSILAWTGKSGHFNSCLPAEISVFSLLSTTHIPSVSEDILLDRVSAHFSGTSPNFTLVTQFYDRLHELPLPMFAIQRMKLPCITFKIERLSTVGSGPRKTFCAQTTALGIVRIQAKENLSQLGSLCIVHPWIDFLLERQPVGAATEKDLEDSTESQFSLVSLPDPPNTTSSATLQNRSTNTNLFTRFENRFGTWPRLSGSYPPRSSMLLTEKQIRALRLIERLKQPFGALLLAQNRQNVEEYRRVAAESMIKVQLQENVPLNELMDGVRVLDVL